MARHKTRAARTPYRINDGQLIDLGPVYTPTCETLNADPHASLSRISKAQSYGAVTNIELIL